MIYKIQNIILDLYEFLTSIHEGIVAVLFLVAIFYSLYMIYSLWNKEWNERTRIEKIFFIPSLGISLLFIALLIFAGDVHPNISAENTARLFAEDVCFGRIEDITKDRDRILTPAYYDNFINEWNREYKNFSDIQCDANNFLLVEYHFKQRDFAEPEKCLVVLRTSDFLTDIFELPSKEPNEIEFCDYDFEIYLMKVALDSRFLGKYMRWRVNDFSYLKSEPYTIKEEMEKFEKLREKLGIK